MKNFERILLVAQENIQDKQNCPTSKHATVDGAQNSANSFQIEKYRLLRHALTQNKQVRHGFC